MKRMIAILALAALLGAASRGSGNTTLSMGLCTIHTASLEADSMKSGNFHTPHVVVNCPTRDVVADSARGNWNHKTVSLIGHVVAHDSQGQAGFADLNGLGKQGTSGPSTLSTDQLDIDSSAKLYTATGNVHYTQGNRTLDAARGVMNDSTKLLTLESVHFVQGTQIVDAQNGVLNDVTHDLDLTGRVHIVDGERTMNASHVLYNTQSGALKAQGNVMVTFPGQTAPAPGVATPKPKKKRLLPF